MYNWNRYQISSEEQKDDKIVTPLATIKRLLNFEQEVGKFDLSTHIPCHGNVSLIYSSP